MYTDIASSSLRELDAVALATNVTVFMERDTQVPPTFRRCQRVKEVVAQVNCQLFLQLQTQFLQLPLVDRGGGTAHEINSSSCLGKSNDVA